MLTRTSDIASSPGTFHEVLLFTLPSSDNYTRNRLEWHCWGYPALRRQRPLHTPACASIIFLFLSFSVFPLVHSPQGSSSHSWMVLKEEPTVSNRSPGLSSTAFSGTSAASWMGTGIARTEIGLTRVASTVGGGFTLFATTLTTLSFLIMNLWVWRFEEHCLTTKGAIVY